MEKRGQNHPQNMEKQSRKPSLTPTVSQEPRGRLLASILAASGRHFRAQSSPGPPPRAPGAPHRGGQIITSPETLGPQGGPGAPREPREASGSQFGSNSRASGGDVRHFFPSPNASRKLLRDRFLFIPLASPTKRYKRQRDATRDPRNWRSFPRQGRGGVVTLKGRLY